MRKLLQRNSSSFLLLLATLLAAALLWGCGGSDSFDTPATATNAPIAGAATNVLVEPATLANWMDQGLLESDGHFDERVVVLDFGNYTMDPAKDEMRIRGAGRLAKSELESPRFEGVANTTPMVATGEQIDAMLQRFGINENTTLVFTTSKSSYFATRAYWTFRYWGFPKERLKVLNGGTNAFAAAYPERMTRDVPSPGTSTFSVRDLPGLNADLRASVGELIDIVDGLPADPANLVIDARGSKNYCGEGATGGLQGGDFVVVDGHPKGGQFLSQAELFVDGKFKSRQEIESLFAAKGWTPGKKVTVYCTSGYSATPLFFALDAMLDASVQLFDGSWSQLGKYSDFAAGGGELPTGSPWAIDKYLAFTEGFRYNIDYLKTVNTPVAIETLMLDSAALAAQPSPFIGDVASDDSDVVPSQIELADAAYVGSGLPTVTFPAPAATATAGVLIDAATLKGWADAGLVNAPLGSERVVVLDVTDELSFYRDKQHIPGAVLWDSGKQLMDRVEGPAPSVNMAITGALMDEMIQAAGIDENTTVVLTSSQSATFHQGRAYFLFRYYGFPKERLKVLNGYNTAWTAAGNTLTVAPAVVTPSTLSVRQIANYRPDLRVSLSELMDAVRDGRGLPVDFRGVKTAAKSTPGVFLEVSGDYVVFEGQLKGGKGFSYAQLNNADGTYKSAADIEALLNAAGIVAPVSEAAPIYSYCRTGMIGSTGFFALDGILGWPVMLYDGSWSQMGKMSAEAAKKGELPADSAWAVDNATYMDVITYNADAPPTPRMQVIEKLNPDAGALLLKPTDAAANQIENADAEYQAEASGNETPAGPPTSGGGSSGGGC